MQSYQILLFPDPFLKKKIRLVSEEECTKLKDLVEQMFEIMYKSAGIGLAASQIGVDKRVFVMDVPKLRQNQFDVDTKKPLQADDLADDKKDLPVEKASSPTKNLAENPTKDRVNNPMFFINPNIISSSEKTTSEEGCLSIPGVVDKVERFVNIEANYLDLTGKLRTIKLKGLEAICFQHELDHLEGKLFWDRMPTLKKNMLKKKFLKQQKQLSD